MPLSDVEFKLEKLKAETTAEGKTQWVVDESYPFDSTNKGSITGTTGMDGKIISNPFKNLEPGTYRLTETKAHPGYNLLAQPIVIEFTQGGTCSIDGQVITDKDKFTQSGNTYTMNLTVLNRKTPELPHTGADAPSLWLLIGMPLAVAGLLIFTFRYNRKGGPATLTIPGNPATPRVQGLPASARPFTAGAALSQVGKRPSFSSFFFFTAQCGGAAAFPRCSAPHCTPC